MFNILFFKAEMTAIQDALRPGDGRKGKQNYSGNKWSILPLVQNVYLSVIVC
jgi:hypothetical protein